MESVAIFCIIVLVITALAAFIARRAPIIDGELKSIIVWAIIAIGVVVVIFRLMSLI